MTDDQLELHLPAPPASDDTPLIPARMVNEFVYCPRLAYLMWTQGEWAETGDTVEGHRVHAPSIGRMRRCRRRKRSKLKKARRETRS